MFSRRTISHAFSPAMLALLFGLGGCTPASDGDGSPSPGNDDGRGGRSGSGGAKGAGGAPGSGGSTPGGSGGQNGSGGQSGGSGGSGSGGASGSSGSGGAVGAGGAGSGGAMAMVDAGSDAAPDSSGAPAGPTAPGQGPTAEGTIKYSQDFELNMDGMSRSPKNLPEDRIQIIADPTGQRGKIVRIHFAAGDNFRTSPGTQPRSWFSAANGYTVKPNTKVSVAWGFMWSNVNMNAHFAQLIRDGGPTWMWDVDGSGNVSMNSHRGTGRTGNIVKLEPMKWYDFMVTTDYRAGGETRYYFNGKLILTGKSPGGPDGRFDFGTYTRPGAHPERTVFISNVSIGEL